MPRVFAGFIALVIALATIAAPAAQDVALGARPGSLKLAVIGDNGTGDPAQYETAQRLVTARARFPYSAVLMLGDNMYGRQDPPDFVDKFERPYAPLLAAGVTFKAALGNHDRPENRDYAPFGMGGQRYYSFVLQQVRFVVLDTNQLDPAQLRWADETLASATEAWKVAVFHHPLYSDARRHGSNVDLRVLLEPILVKNGVRVALSGHEHVYERTHPQKGITYFVNGIGGQLRKGDLDRRAPTCAAGFDTDRAFMLVEVGDTEFAFQVVSRTGVTVDSGVVSRRFTT